MRIIRTRIEDVYLIENAKFEDDRGSFVKVFNKSSFTDGELEYDFKESFYSSSSKGGAIATVRITSISNSW